MNLVPKFQRRQLLGLYLQSKPTFKRDREDLGGLEGFPTLPVEIGGKH